MLTSGCASIAFTAALDVAMPALATVAINILIITPLIDGYPITASIKKAA
jgi:uncharacterized membrane protein YccC